MQRGLLLLAVTATLPILSTGAAIAAAPAGQPRLPHFDPGDFKAGQPINNPYFPLREGFTYHFAGRELNDAGRFVSSPDNMRVQQQRKQIDGVQAVVDRDNVYHNNLLEETTLDYYAQDRRGNVWYLGEFETAFTRDKQGNVIRVSHEGSWEAGVKGAEPGFIMKAHPTVATRALEEPCWVSAGLRTRTDRDRPSCLHNSKLT